MINPSQRIANEAGQWDNGAHVVAELYLVGSEPQALRSMSQPYVIALTSTYRRVPELARWLASLATEQPALAGAVIVDNGNDPAVAQAAASHPFPVRVIPMKENLGCGGGIAFGLREVFRAPESTHVWICDDDSMAAPGALAAMLDAAASTGADAVAPLITDAQGHLGWFPGPLPQPAWDSIRKTGQTVEGFRAECGMTPLRWNWSPWTSLLVSRRAVEAVGLPRDDYWFQGEDIEWTLRITGRFSGVLAPSAHCLHHPPAAFGEPAGHAERERLKTLSMIQNNAFTASRLRHGRRILRHLPGNAWRFLKSQHATPTALGDAAYALWSGMARGKPAGAPGSDRWRKQWGNRA